MINIKIMNLPQISVSRLRGITIIYVSFIVLALFALKLIPVDILPPVEAPYVSVAITYQSASPEQIEQQVVKYVEEQIKVVEGVEEIRSICEQGVAVVQVKFRVGENLDFAVQRINERLEFLKRTITDPNIQFAVLRFTSSTFPVLFLGVTGKRDRAGLYNILDRTVSPYISSLPGVGGTLILADAQRNLNIWVDPEKMRKYNIGILDVKNAIAQYNGDFSAGKISLGGQSSVYATVKGKFSSIDDAKEIVVAVRGGIPIKLKDIAEIEVSSRYVDSSRSYFFGSDGEQETVLLYLVRKRPGANIVEVSDEVKKSLQKISNELPADVKIRVLLDFADSIRKTIDELKTTIYYSVIAISIITFVFVRRIRELVILVVSIPTSLFFTILTLYFLGRSLNIITLSAIIASSGIVIDNSIVVLESIKRRQSEGKPFLRAIIDGANYVFIPLLGSTVTNFIVFLPIVFIKGISFYLFLDFALVITVASIISLFVAVTLIPALSSKLLGKEEFSYPMEWLEKGYKRALRLIINHPFISLVIISSVGFIPILLFPKVKKEFLRVQEGQDMRIFVYLYKSASWHVAEKTAFKIKDEIYKKMPGKVEYMFLRYGESSFGRAFGRAQRFTEAENLILIGIRFKEISYANAYKIISDVISSDPNVEEFRIISANPVNLFIFGQSRGIEMQVYSDLAEENYLKFLERLKEIRNFIRGLDFVRAADIEIGEPVPELQLTLWDYGKSLGFSPAYLGDFLSTLITGTQIGTVTLNGLNMDVFIRTKEGREIDLESFLRIPVKSPIVLQDGYVHLSDIARIRWGLSPSEIQRINSFRVGIISVDTAESDFVAAQKLKSLVEKNFPDVRVDFGGSVQEFGQTFSSVLAIFGLAIFLGFASMVVILESFSLPFIILFTIPLAIAGVFLALFLTGIPLSLLSFISTFLLAGVVVNNGIVLLEVIQKKYREENLDLVGALIEGGGERLRPILMTSLTTILGVFPSIFGSSETLVGGRDFAVPTIGGLIYSSFFTLFLMPTMYYIFMKIPEKLLRKKLKVKIDTK